MNRLILMLAGLALATPSLAMTAHGAAGGMAGMTMGDRLNLGMVRVDQLEVTKDDAQRWEAQAWYGNDEHKLWLRSEGERRDGRLHEGDVEVLWYRPLTAFWGTQLGLRHDFGGDGRPRDWTALGVQGLAPYWFEVEATAYAGPEGRTAARLRAHYDLLITQRLILQPEIESNAYGSSDPANGIGNGLADGRLSLRLRYEIRREFAPYLGVVHARRFGDSATLARQAGEATGETQLVAGLRFWF